jgi:hypothetical protein
VKPQHTGVFQPWQEQENQRRIIAQSSVPLDSNGGKLNQVDIPASMSHEETKSNRISISQDSQLQQDNNANQQRPSHGQNYARYGSAVYYPQYHPSNAFQVPYAHHPPQVPIPGYHHAHGYAVPVGATNPMVQIPAVVYKVAPIFQIDPNKSSHTSAPVHNNGIPSIEKNAERSPTPQARECSQNAKPMKKTMRHGPSKKHEMDTLLHPAAKKLDGYYLDDDAKLVEEDPLQIRPEDQFRNRVFNKFALPASATTGCNFRAIPLRSIGGIQDQIQGTKITCTCKGHANHMKKNRKSGCLILYCDCFATGEYCNDKCVCSAICFNTAAEHNVKPRTEAIVDNLQEDPDAFRYYNSTIAEQQKQYRRRSEKAEARATKLRKLGRSSAAASDNGSKTPSPKSKQSLEEIMKTIVVPTFTYDGTKSGIDDVDDIPPSDEVLRKQLQPSYYTVPLTLNDGSVLTGLSFAETHPRNRKPKKRLYHDLMLSPSMAVKLSSTKQGSHGRNRSLEIEKTVPTMQANEQITTEKISYQESEIQKTEEFFQAMRDELATTQNKNIPFTLFQTDFTSATKAVAALRAIEDDMKDIKKSVDAAKIHTMNCYCQKRMHVEYLPDEDDFSNVDKNFEARSASDKRDHGLQYKAERGSVDLSRDVAEESELKELTILAAQDTALFQELSRIIRRKARALCEARIKQEVAADADS